VILAGYKDRMNTFFKANAGMASRIAHHIDFPDYSEDELMQIAQLMLAQMNYRLDGSAEGAMQEYIARRLRRPHFANARSIRNALDRARLRQANRLFAAAQVVDRNALTTLSADDLYASRVFQELDADSEGEAT